MGFISLLYLVILVVVSTDGQPTVQECDGPGDTCSQYGLKEQVLQLTDTVSKMQAVLSMLRDNEKQTQSALSELTDTVRQIQASLSDLDSKVNLLTTKDETAVAPLLNSSMINLPDSAFTASSYIDSKRRPACARIHVPRDPPAGCNSAYYWYPASGSTPSSSWWQVELSKTDTYKITGVETQGLGGAYISQYKISYIMSQDLIPYLDEDRNEKVFTVTNHAPNRQELSPPITTRTTRINVVTCAPRNDRTYCLLRVELYGYRL